MGSIKIASEAITGRELSIAIPKGSMTAVQRDAIEAARIRARTFGIDLKITEF
jgi:predicted KAP-like P-loop ATPase